MVSLLVVDGQKLLHLVLKADVIDRISALKLLLIPFGLS